MNRLSNLRTDQLTEREERAKSRWLWLQLGGTRGEADQAELYPVGHLVALEKPELCFWCLLAIWPQLGEKLGPRESGGGDLLEAGRFPPHGLLLLLCSVGSVNFPPSFLFPLAAFLELCKGAHLESPRCGWKRTIFTCQLRGAR